MSNNVIINTLLTANAKQLLDAFGQGEKGAKKMAAPLDELKGKIAAAFSAAAVIAFVKDVTQASVQFDSSMRNVNTIAGLTEEQFQKTKDQVKDLAFELGKQPDELAKALYDINSAGFTASDGMKVLEQATIAGKAGLASTTEAAKAITGTLNAFGMSADQAGNVADIMFQTVKKGVINFEQLAGGLGNVNSTAAAAGIGFDEVGAAIAAMTANGISADESFTALNGLIMSFIKPSEEMTAQFQKITGELPLTVVQTQGLSKALDVLRQASDGDVAATAEMITEKRALKAALALTGEGAGKYKDAVNSITDEQERAGAAAAAMEEQNKSLASSWDDIQAAIAVTKIAIGDFFAFAGRSVLDFADYLGRLSVGELKQIELDFGNIKQSAKEFYTTQKLLTEEAERLKKGIAEVKDITEKLAQTGFGNFEQLTDANEKLNEIYAQRERWVKAIADESKRQDDIERQQIDNNKDLILARKRFGDESQEVIALLEKEEKLSVAMIDSIRNQGVWKRELFDLQLKITSAEQDQVDQQKDKEENEKLYQEYLAKRTELETEHARLVEQYAKKQEEYNYRKMDSEQRIAFWKSKQIELQDAIGKLNASDLTERNKIVELQNELLDVTNNLEVATKAAADETARIADEAERIQLPDSMPMKMDEEQARLWTKFLKDIADIATKIEIRISLTKLSEAQVDWWKDLLGFIKNIKIDPINIGVNLPKLTQDQVQYWKDFFTAAQGIGNIAIDLQLPKELKNGIPLKIEDKLNLNLDSITKSLETLANLKGVIFA